MADAIIEELKHHFADGAIPPQNVLREIFEQKSAKFHEYLAGNGSADVALRREAIQEMVKLLYEEKTEEARNINKRLGLSPEDFLELAKITFDIAGGQKNPESQYRILSSFMLDPRRISIGVLAYMAFLIGKGKYDKASEIKKQYRDNIRKSDLEKMGKDFFEESMSFDSTEEKRDYLPAQKINELFNVDGELVKKHALAQYDFNITHDRQEEALDVARLFKLTGDKVIQASKSIFEKRFDEFSERLYDGKYRGTLELEANDPYRQALAAAQQNGFLDTSGKKVPRKIVDEVQSKAFALLQRLNTYTEGSEIDPAPKLFFAVSIISDYKLMTMSDPKSCEQCKEIAKSLVDNIEEQMTFVDQAISSYPVLCELYKNAPNLRPSIRNIAIRMFGIFLETNRTKFMETTLEDFELKTGDVAPTIKKKILDLLEANKIEELQKLEKTFPSIDRLRSDNDFMLKAFHIFDQLLTNGDLEKARIIQKLLKFSANRIAMPVKLSLRGLFRKEKFEEAKHLIETFNVNKHHIRDLLLEVYERELDKSSRDGSYFREQFNLGIGDIGFLRWLLKEVLNF